MSRKKKSPASATKSDSPAPKPSPADSNPATSSELPWKQIGLAVFVLAGIWYIALISLAALTGNPVTINQLQIRQSDLVVSGTVDENGVVSHINVHKVRGMMPEGEIRISNFEWPPGNYILPLKRERGQLEVTRSELPDKPPLIYPANDESIVQLLQILKKNPRGK